MELIESSFGCIDSNYDIHVGNVKDIRNASSNPYDMICYGFRFGYMQGIKAASIKTKKSAQ